LDSGIRNTDGKQQNPFSNGAGQALLTLPYRPASTHKQDAIQSLHQLLSYWIKEHRPLKKMHQEKTYQKKKAPKKPKQSTEAVHA